MLLRGRISTAPIDSLSERERLLDLAVLAMDRDLAGAFPLRAFSSQRDCGFTIFGFADAGSVVFFNNPATTKSLHVQTFVFEWHTWHIVRAVPARVRKWTEERISKAKAETGEDLLHETLCT